MIGCRDKADGFVLVAALCVMAILMVLGSAAMTMSELGYISFSAEKAYQAAYWAAEYAIRQGARLVDRTCPASGAGGTAGDAGYQYRYQTAGNDLCVVQGTGISGNARVVKTGAVPFGEIAPEYGALTLRSGGTVQVSGSGIAANCDPSCAAPGILSGGTLKYNGPSPVNSAHCPPNAGGVYGTPDGMQNSDGSRCSPGTTAGTCTGAELPDRTGIVFSHASDWTSLQSAISGLSFGGNLTFDAANLSVKGLPDPPSPACTCTDEGNVTLSSSTSSCTGVSSFSACGGLIRFTDQSGVMTVFGLHSSISTVVSAKPVVVTGVSFSDADFTKKRLYTTGAASMTIDDDDVHADNLSDTDATVFSSSGDLIISRMGRVIRGLFVSRSGRIIINHGDYDKSVIVAASAGGTVTLQGGSANDSRLVSPHDIVLATPRGLTDLMAFGGSVALHQGSAVMGGIIYAAGDITTGGSGTGTLRVGTAPDPALVIAGGDLRLQHPDAADIHGLVFVQGALRQPAGGAVTLLGALLANGTTGDSAVLLGHGSSLTFSAAAIETISSRPALQGLVKPPSCGRGSKVQRKADYFLSTRITAY